MRGNITQDDSGSLLVQSDTSSADSLTCYYLPDGQYSLQFYCIYSTSSGIVTMDSDDGYCKQNAIKTN